MAGFKRQLNGCLFLARKDGDASLRGESPWNYLIAKLKEALDHLQLLSGLLPICASCKKIKDEREVWQPLESYIQAHSEAKFTHGLCLDCLRKLDPGYHQQ